MKRKSWLIVTEDKEKLFKRFITIMYDVDTAKPISSWLCPENEIEDDIN